MTTTMTMRTAALLTLILHSGRAFQIGSTPTSRAHAILVSSAHAGDDDDYYRHRGGSADVADDDDDDDDRDASYTPPRKYRTFQPVYTGSEGAASSSAPASTFYSRKVLTDPAFSLAPAAADAADAAEDGDARGAFFRRLCHAAGIARPSRIQSLAWPPLLRGEHAIVADQTGSGKTLAYLLPLLQKLHRADGERRIGGATARKKERAGSPPIVILAPTAELADQIHDVCASLARALSHAGAWTFRPFVTTATGAHATNIRDQIRQLRTTPVDVLISTPGRLATILRTKSAGLDLGSVTALVLDEVDFLLADETFGPQLRAVGAAVHGGGDGGDGGNDADGHRREGVAQCVFVTATLPEDVLSSIQAEFPAVAQIRGPGLHRVAPAVVQTLVDVSVPAARNRDARACVDVKVRELTKALRGRRCARTLVFCNTVETCRNVENVLRRQDRGGRRTRVWCYHGALSHEARVRNLQEFSGGGGRGGGEQGGPPRARDRGDDGTERILVCTDRAARGIDFAAAPVDHVLLFDFPKDPAEYVRRVGRTARAGRPGASTVLAYGWQLPVARQIMGLSSGSGRKDGKGKRGNGKLESFTMKKSSDGWEQEEKEDDYYVKGGARRRRELSPGGSGGGGHKKKARRKSYEKQGGNMRK